jgi:hypothetical protein
VVLQIVKLAKVTDITPVFVGFKVDTSKWFIYGPPRGFETLFQDVTNSEIIINEKTVKTIIPTIYQKDKYHHTS